MNEGNQSRLQTWLRMQMATVYLTLLRLRNTLMFWLWPLCVAKVQQPFSFLKRNPKWLYRLKVTLSVCLTAVTLFVVAWGPLRMYWEQYREDLKGRWHQSQVKKQVQNKDPYQKILTRMQSFVSDYFQSGRGLHPRYGMPFHTVTTEGGWPYVIVKEKRVNPKDNAFVLLYALQAYRHQGKLRSKMDMIERILESLVDFSEKNTHYHGLFPLLRFDFKEGLQGESNQLSLTENAWLSWSLAAVQTYFMSFPEEDKNEQVKRIISLTEPLLDKQDYGIFYDAKKKRFLREMDLKKKSTQLGSYARYAWEEDVLGLLWAIVRGHLPKEDVTQAWEADIPLVLSLYPASNDSYWDAPLTRHGHLGDLEPHVLLLPHTEKELGILTQNAIAIHAHHAHENQWPGLLGAGYAKDGRWHSSGIELLSLQQQELQHARPSLGVTALASVVAPDVMRPWLAQAFTKLQPKHILLARDVALMGMSSWGPPKDLIQSYLQRIHRWPMYQRLWLQKVAQTKTNKAGQNVLAVQAIVRAPSLRSSYKEQLPWAFEQEINLMDMLASVSAKTERSQDSLVLSKESGYWTLRYRLTQPAHIFFELDQGSVLPWNFHVMEMAYEWASQQQLAVKWSFKQRDIVLARCDQKSLDQGLFQWDRSSWQSLPFVLNHSLSQCHRRATHLVMHLSSPDKFMKGYPAEGVITLQNVSLIPESIERDVQDLEVHVHQSQKPLNWGGYPPEWLDCFRGKYMEAHGTFMDSKATYAHFERRKETEGLVGVSVRFNSNHPLEEPWKALGLRLQPGLWGSLPPYMQVTAQFVNDAKVQTTSWNIDLSQGPLAEKAKEYLILSLPESMGCMNLRELRCHMDTVLNAEKFYSWHVSDVALLTQEEREQIKLDKHDFIYDHQNQLVRNILNSSVSVIKDAKWVRENDAVIFPETQGVDHVFEIVLYPEQKLQGQAIVIQGSPEALPDGFFRLQLYSNEELLLDRDIHLRHGLRSQPMRIALPHSLLGRVLNRVNVSHVQGVVHIQQMYVT